MGQKCKQKASLLICIWKILIFLLWIHIVGPYRLFWNNRLICGGNMWVAAVVQKIPLGISIRPQFIMLWKIMGAFLRQILLPIFTANITWFLNIQGPPQQTVQLWMHFTGSKGKTHPILFLMHKSNNPTFHFIEWKFNYEKKWVH